MVYVGVCRDQCCRLSRALGLTTDLEGSEEQVSEGLDGAEEFFEGNAAAVLTRVHRQQEEKTGSPDKTPQKNSSAVTTKNVLVSLQIEFLS